MYIVAIGWLYVTLLIAVNEPSVVGGSVGRIVNYSPTSA